MSLKVNEPSKTVLHHQSGWALGTALMGGTQAMRAAGKAYLPQWPKEPDDKYKARLLSAVLLPTFQRTVRVMASKPFSKPLTLRDNVPARVRELCMNADRQGNSLHSFMSRVMPWSLSHGLHGVLVDYPRVDIAQATQADAIASGARPYMVHICPGQLLGWVIDESGSSLAQLRFLEFVKLPDGPFGEAVVPQVRVLWPGRWETWRQPEGGTDFELFEAGVSTIADEIPFVPFYGEASGFMEARSPLLELGHLNVRHWQSQSDQDNLLHVARVPILFAKGFEEKDELIVGAASAVRTSNTEATLEYVEHTGEAIGAGQSSLDALERQMLQIGAELLVPREGGQRSATEANNEAEANKSDLLRIAEQHEDAIDRCLHFMARYLGEASGGNCELFKDFQAAALSDASAQLVVTMAGSGLIRRETAVKEMQRRGVLSPEIKPEEEVAMAQDEAAPPSGDTLDQEGAQQPASAFGADGSSAQGPATTQLDLTPAVSAIEALGSTIEALGAAMKPGADQAPPAPPDMTAVAAAMQAGMDAVAGAIAAIKPPVITVEAPISVAAAPAPDMAPIASALAANGQNLAAAIGAMQPAAVTVTSPPVNVTVHKGGEVTFTEDDDGRVVGAKLN